MLIPFTVAAFLADAEGSLVLPAFQLRLFLLKRQPFGFRGLGGYLTSVLDDLLLDRSSVVLGYLCVAVRV
jgi:hypothetical protein